MRTRTGKRILAVFLSAVTAVCTAGTVQAEEGIVSFVQEQAEGDYARPDGSDVPAAAEEIVPGALEIPDTEPEAEQVTEEPERDGQVDAGGEEVELVSVEEVAGEIGEGDTSEDQLSGETVPAESQVFGEGDTSEGQSSGETIPAESQATGEGDTSESQSSGETVSSESQAVGEGDTSEDQLSEETVPIEISALGEETSGDADDEIIYAEERTFRSGDAKDGAASRIFMRSTLEYEHCYGDQLVGESRGIYDALVKSWACGGTEGVTYKLSQPLSWNEGNVALVYQDVDMAYCAFAYDYPEVFWLGMISVSPGRNSSNMLSAVFIEGRERYWGAKSEVEEFNQAVASAEASVRNLLPADADRYAVVKTIHDYICETAEYDAFFVNCGEFSDTAHSAAGIFLKDRVVVCEGYAKAFKILCGRFGIECALIIGDAGGAHMWNYVKMDDGRWYLVDTTWDDQGSQIMDTYLLAGSMSSGFHGNLILSERQSWTDFSGSGAKNYVLPVLSSGKYEHIQHSWSEISRTEATCRSYATAEYLCEDCGMTKTEIVGPETGHVWGPYVSNNDATWRKDGTKTALCRYGCGTENTVVDTGSMLRRSIKVNVSSLRLKVKQSTSAVKVTLVRGDRVTSWKSNKPAVVSVNSKGKITAGKKTGKAVITISTLSGLKKKITVIVQKNDVQTTGITGLSGKITLKKGGKLQLSPVIKPVTSLQKVTYASSNKKIAAVTAKGVITGKKAGTAKITVKSGTKTFRITVQVKK